MSARKTDRVRCVASCPLVAYTHSQCRCALRLTVSDIEQMPLSRNDHIPRRITGTMDLDGFNACCKACPTSSTARKVKMSWKIPSVPSHPAGSRASTPPAYQRPCGQRSPSTRCYATPCQTGRSPAARPRFPIRAGALGAMALDIARCPPQPPSGRPPSDEPRNRAGASVTPPPNPISPRGRRILTSSNSSAKRFIRLLPIHQAANKAANIPAG